MTEIKIAKAWGLTRRDVLSEKAVTYLSDTYLDMGYEDKTVQVHVIHGLSDAEAAALPEIMERERGVCEWVKHHWMAINCKGIEFHSSFTFCPSCGRRVKIK